MASNVLIASTRQPGPVQGWVLVVSSWLSVIASGALIGPILPTMAAHFSTTPHADVLISLVATLPCLFVALLATPIGILADRIGHRRLLFWSTLIYGFLGIAPYWLDSLQAIVVSRGIVGIAEAAIMTCSAALVGHYFRGNTSARWYALQTGTAPIIAIVAIMLGGGLGESNWHNPFLVYCFGGILFALVATLLWEPETQGERVDTGELVESPDEKINWPKLLVICCITLFALSALLVTIIQTSFLLTERGVTSPRMIGFWQSLATLSNPLGAVVFGFWRANPKMKVSVSLLLMGLGFGVIGMEQSWQAALIGAAITNLGCGIILPTLITWALDGMPDAKRGLGTGAWMGASYLGQFISPLTVIWLKSVSGSLSNALLCYATACLVAACISIAFVAVERTQSPRGLKS